MNSVDTVKALMKAIEDKDWDKAASCLSDDFQFIGPVNRQPVSREGILAIDEAFSNAFPDLSYNVHQAEELSDGRVSILTNFTGTQTGPLVLPIRGVPPIPPTGKRVVQPDENTIYTLRDGKIIRAEVAAVPGGGLPGILSQLGVAMPAPRQ